MVFAEDLSATATCMLSVGEQEKDMSFHAITLSCETYWGESFSPKEYDNQTDHIPDWCSLINPPLEMMFESSTISDEKSIFH